MIINFSIFLLFITFIANVIVGVFVISKGLYKRISLLFGSFVIQLAIWNLVNLLSFLFTNPDLQLLFARISLFTVMFIPFSFNNFVYEFTDYRLSKAIKVILLLPAIVMSLFVFTSHNIRYTETHILEPGILYLFYTIYFFALLWTSFIYLLKKYRSTTDILKKYQMKYILIGMVSFSTFAIIANAILPLLGTTALNISGTASSLILTASVAYAITRYNLLDIKFFIRKQSIKYGIILFNSLIATLIVVFAQAIVNDYLRILLFFIMFISIQSIFIYLVNKISADKYFFYGSMHLDFSKGGDQLLIRFYEEIQKTLTESYPNIQHEIFVLDPKLQCYLPLSSSCAINFSYRSELVTFFRKYTKFIMHDSDLQEIVDVSKNTKDLVKKTLHQNNFLTLAPLHNQYDLYGFIALYKTKNIENMYNVKGLENSLEKICRSYGPMLEKILIHNSLISNSK